MNGSRRAFAMALAAAACGCSFAPVEVETRRHVLAAMPAQVPRSNSVPSALLVPPPEARAPYDGVRMAYSTAAFEVRHFAANEWAERPARMLQPLLVRTLERTAHFGAVVTPPYAGPVGFVLRTELLELRQDFTAQPAVARVVLRAELHAAEPARIVATRELEAAEPLAQATPEAGVRAANTAIARLLGDLARFVVGAAR